MVGKRRQRRSSRRSRRRSGPSRIIDEYFTFSIRLGSSQNVLFSNISTRPPNVNLRPVFFSVQAFAGFRPSPASDQISGFLVPAAFSVQLYSNGILCTTSPPVVATTSGSRAQVHYPTSGAWLPSTTLGTGIVARIEAICLGTAGTAVDSFLRGVAHLRYRVSNEILTPSCPTALKQVDSSDEDSLSLEHLSIQTNL